MNRDNLIYETLITEFLGKVPELREKAEEEADLWRRMSDQDFKEYQESLASLKKELPINLSAFKNNDGVASFFLLCRACS